jgi:capsular polysaccharide biosynthesis protein
MDEEKFQTEYDEIDLMDYVKVILKRKWLILVIFFGAAIAAGIFSFLMPKVYRIDTSLEVGIIERATATMPEQLVELPTQLVEKIKGDVYGISVREKLGISEEKYPKIKTENPKDTRLINLAIESAEPQKAKNILEEINNLILVEHQEIIKTKKELIEQDIKTTEDKIKLVESDIEKTKNKIQPINEDIKRIENKIANAEEEKENLEAKVDALQKVLPYQQDPGTQFALFDTKEKLANKKQEIENLYLTINSLKRSKEDLDVQINSLKTNIESLNAQINALRASLDEIKPTQVIKSPTVSEKPIKPNKKLNIVIAAVLGLFVGVFLAFFQEWWEKSKV